MRPLLGSVDESLNRPACRRKAVICADIAERQLGPTLDSEMMFPVARKIVHRLSQICTR